MSVDTSQQSVVAKTLSGLPYELAVRTHAIAVAAIVSAMPQRQQPQLLAMAHST